MIEELKSNEKYDGLDLNLIGINIEWDNIKFIFSTIEEKALSLICWYYIGYCCIGHWDEAIIKSIELKTSGELIESSKKEILKNYGTKPDKGGGIMNIYDDWKQLEIILIDDVKITVACQSAVLQT